MKIDIVTLFPDMFKGPFDKSIIMRGQKNGLIKINIHHLRNWAVNRHGQVDDRPYGGGAGMIMRVDTAFNALRDVCSAKKVGSQKISNFQFPISNSGVSSRPYIILPTPSGEKFDQATARRLAKKKHLVFLCPHYEGYDHRIESLVSEKISIGDYVLTGGELPAMVVVDAVVRLIPGVIKKESLEEESFSQNPKSQISMSNQTLSPKSQEIGYWSLGLGALKYEYPQYTRPEVFEMRVGGKKIKKRVPKVLLLGNHEMVREWREKQSK